MPSNRFPMGSNLKEYWNHDRLTEVQNQLLNGQKPKECEWCWKNEDNNLKTHRIDKPKNINGIHSIHIRLNNVCNFKCRMCGPAFSSSWAIENKKHGYFVFEDNEVTKDSFSHTSEYLFPLLKREINKGNLKQLSISGGEPLITDAHYKLLSFLIDNNLTDITLGYSTNLSRLDYKGVDLLSMWSKFKKVSIEASLDGWGKGVEYSRTGFSMQTFKENFIKAFNFIDTINCVVNIYSVWTLPQIEKFKQYGKRIVYSPCYLPIQCNPQLLLEEDKNHLLEMYKDYPSLVELYKNFIDKGLEEGYHMNDTGTVPDFFSLERIRKEMITYNLLLDKHRDTNFFETFPQFEKYKEL